MELKDITVKKFIALADISQATHYDTEIDRQAELLSCMHEKPVDYYLSMTLGEFRKHTSELEIINLDKIKPAMSEYIRVNGRVYKPVCDFTKLSAAQYIDVLSFVKETETLLENIPNVLASICVPTKRTLFGRKTLPYLSTPHARVAEDMESASIEEAYGLAVFFWTVWQGLLRNTADFLVPMILKTKKGEKLTQSEKEGLLNILQVYGDGIIAANGSQPLSV